MTQQNKSECSNCGRDGDELGGVVCRECSGLDEVQDELAALKREHEQLRAAVDSALSDLQCADLLCWCFTRAAMQGAVCACDNCGARGELRAALDETPAEPSERAVEMMRQAQTLATAEVERHLAAGRKVYGRRDGERVVLEPAPAEPVRETFDADAVRKMLACEAPILFALRRPEVYTSTADAVAIVFKTVRDSERK